MHGIIIKHSGISLGQLVEEAHTGTRRLDLDLAEKALRPDDVAFAFGLSN